ncbi:hypothetical protein G6644_09230, partial [Polynucleobacter paneuropaeus]|nr:hypothetical protein [Polynucleobacter paneuropaeus]MBT8639234.1 hypothetical protein [Polynucleobacter paneuropaeus]
ANTSGTASNITYDTTGGAATTTNSKLATVTTGALSIGANSTSAINYSVLTAGARIDIAGVVSVPGTITLDNTYGCTGVSCAPATGYLNTALASWATYVTTSYGVQVESALTGTAITIKGINNAASTGAVLLQAALVSTTGDINITGTTTSGWAITNYVNGVGAYNNTNTANSGAINLTATATTTGYGVDFVSYGAMSAKSITVIGNSAGNYAAYLGAMTIVSGGGNINVTGTVATSSNTAIYQAGAIADNAAGSNISFIANGIINQTGTIALVANTTGTAASITYNTTSDGIASTIATGALTVAAGTNSSAINFIAKSAGAAINPGVIGSTTVALPGYVLLDNTYGCSGTGCTPITGFINTTSANLSLATTSIGLTINNAIYASGSITLNGIASGSQGINYSAVMTSTANNVTLNGGTTNNYAVYNGGQATLITANNINITGTSTLAAGWDVYIGPLTINSAATGGSITVTGNVINTPGVNGG